MLRNSLLPTLFLMTSTAAWVEAQPPSAATHPMNLAGYLAELGRWELASQRLKDHPEEAAELRKALPESWSVEVNGELYVVPADWLASSLESYEKHPKSASEYTKKLKTRLEAIRAEVSALAHPSPNPDLDMARAKAEEILKRREFRHVQGPSWLTRFRHRLGTWLIETMGKLLGGMRVPAGETRTLGWVLAVGLALIFLVWLVRQFLGRPFRRGMELPPPPSPAEGWRNWARKAVAAAARGQYRDAIRLAYWAGVYQLGESGVWEVERWRTPREYLRLLPADHPKRNPLSTLTSRFERVWYGGQAASAEDFQFTVTQLEKLGCAFPSNPATGNS